MTDFAETGRQRCRNKQCRLKLPSPTINDHHAFCTKGCHEGFYAKRCLVCEKDLPPGSRADRKFCRRPKCRAAYRQNPGNFAFGYIPPSNAEISPETPILRASKAAPIPVEVERIEARNRAALRAAGIPDLPLLGGCFTDPEWREVISPDGVRCFVARRNTGIAFQHSDWRPVSPARPILDDLSIPKLLQRAIATNKRAAV